MEGSDSGGSLAALVNVNLVGDSELFRALVKHALHVAQFDVTISIYGETGAGKEVLAEAIHFSSPRAQGPFIPVNCGALTDSLLESELFGHEKGAFTHAVQSHQGLVEQADGGTLFLDEIEELSPHSQATLLRFLQDFRYRRVGGKSIRRANVRILTATNIPLQTLRDEQRLREDLYYRLNVVPLRIPNLRERPEDILLLAGHFLRRQRAQLNLPNKHFSADAKAWLRQQPWPGNVRELENVILRGVLSSLTDTIEPKHFLEDSALQDIVEPGDVHACGLHFNTAKQQAIDTFERIYLRNLLTESQGNVTKAARLAGKERRALGKLLKKHQITPAQFCHNSDASV